ncbi:hypothetical protein PSI9734_01980 [Pseudidiomarina piscicola]|uniref:DUF945 domain-containing protein n=1 Tax=Pseudidiomarina piscicola TaxID=2614830 RepID=A0A6S6WR17_9GAMM|nr:DUF945 family protein [Pseudidiomarina piscicola]CAB0151606.1 hypothetical protein PSI9734_01980 [Pseudidiomarina piscicola]VZT41071.1 hypothetical protein PSI9734_01980 [Pseudomonas aeruginosa]
MSKKGIVIGAVVIAGVLTATPYIVGSQTEGNIYKQVAHFDQSQPVYQAKVLSYERNWLSSNAVIEVGVDMQALAGVDTSELQWLTTELDLSLQHGPVLTDQGLSLGLLSWQLSNDGAGFADVLDWNKDQLLYLQQGSVNLLGNANYQDVLAALRNAAGLKDLQFELAEYRGHGTYDGETLTYQGGVADFRLQADSMQVAVDNVQVEGAAEASFAAVLAGDFYAGEGRVAAESLAVTDARVGEVLVAEAMTMDYLTALEQKAEATDGSVSELARMVINFGADTLRVNAIEAKDITLHTMMSHLDKAFIDRYLDTLRDTANAEPEQIGEALATLFEQHGLAFLKANPEFAITEFSGSLPQGAFNANAAVSVNGVTAMPTSMEDDAFWREHIRMHSDATVAKPLMQWAMQSYVHTSLMSSGQAQNYTQEQLTQLAAQQAALMTQTFVQQGLLEDAGDSYKFNFSVADDTLTLNGQESPLGQALGAM